MNLFAKLNLEAKIKKKITLDMPHEKVIQISVDETIRELEESPIRHSIFGTLFQNVQAPKYDIPRDRAEKLEELLAKNKKWQKRKIIIDPQQHIPKNHILLGAKDKDMKEFVSIPVKHWAYLTLPGKRGPASKKFKRIWWKHILGMSLKQYVMDKMEYGYSNRKIEADIMQQHVNFLPNTHPYYWILDIRNRIKKTIRWCKWRNAKQNCRKMFYGDDK
ncbi:MAG: hypothetical protein KKD44_27280 [Proteobacteria bacterium]|nr:hypothetical protein [Pseudomonadota bacterium]